MINTVLLVLLYTVHGVYILFKLFKQLLILTLFFPEISK